MAVAKKVASILRSADVDVVLTRDTDKLLADTINADLGMRCKVANHAKADIFVSIHCNSSTNPSANGTEIYYCTGSSTGYRLAAAIKSYLLPALGLRDRGIKQANFAVLRSTNMPATLVELTFISNPTEEGLLESPAFQDKAARAIAEGVADYLGIELPANDVPKIRVGKKELSGIIVDGTTYAPVRAIAEALGRKVIWDNDAKVVVVE